MFLPHNVSHWGWFPFHLQWHHTSRNMRAARDMQNYRRGYPVSDSSSGMLITTGRGHPVLILSLPYRIWPKMSARKTKWPTCSFISINIVLRLMVKHPHTLAEHSWHSVPSVCTDLLSLGSPQMSTLNPFLRSGRMTTRDWREFTRTFSGTYVYACVAYVACCRGKERCMLSLSSRG